jgi:tripartite-type tricarboxylate transporter receptor subunit TctC
MGVGVWVALMIPAGAPAEVVRKLNGEMNAILEQQEAKDAISKLGLVPQGGTPERLTSVVKSDVERWSRAVVAAKIKMD